MRWVLPDNARMLLISITMYVTASAIDISTTYWGVIITKKYRELNPLVAQFIETNPIYLWYVKDLLLLIFIILTAIAFRLSILYLSRVSKLFWGAEQVAEKYWAIVLIAAIFKLMPGLHNLILIFGG